MSTPLTNEPKSYDAILNGSAKKNIDLPIYREGNLPVAFEVHASQNTISDSKHYLVVRSREVENQVHSCKIFDILLALGLVNNELWLLSLIFLGFGLGIQFCCHSEHISHWWLQQHSRWTCACGYDSSDWIDCVSLWDGRQKEIQFKDDMGFQWRVSIAAYSTICFNLDGFVILDQLLNDPPWSDHIMRCFLDG